MEVLQKSVAQEVKDLKLMLNIKNSIFAVFFINQGEHQFCVVKAYTYAYKSLRTLIKILGEMITFH